MGIDLDLSKISVNPGRREVAKLCLNSLWGKFGQRVNLSQTEYITNCKRWYEILLDDTLDITNCLFFDNDMAQVIFCVKEQFLEKSTQTNVFIAAFTTANARLRLYDMLDKLVEAVVYFDTDSVVYINDGLNTVETGELLGDWSDELPADDYIIEFFSTGPKSYTFKTKLGREVTKINGFTLNYENSLYLNRDVLVDIITEKLDNTVLYYDQICRDVHTKNIVTTERVSKTFRMDYNKRRPLPENNRIIDTLPWGF
ncbi:uncharacterized protein [Diabrotica undecimpunctata]|uniref:uncharacterized protein n=1 Tax=Diabrotica undecimpunctata TaxID=50387 RepID=UPI003B631A35